MYFHTILLQVSLFQQVDFQQHDQLIQIKLSLNNYGEDQILDEQQILAWRFLKNIIGINQLPFISFPLNKGMNCITICFNWGNNYHTILVLQFDWSWYRYSPFGNGFLYILINNNRYIIKCSTVFNSEGNISNSVTMFWLMSIHFLFVILVRSWKSKKHTLVVFHHMSNNISVTSFKASDNYFNKKNNYL